MIRCQAKKGTNQVRVTFTVPEEHLYGRVVALVGDFNDWDASAAPMRREGDGRVATVTLRAGNRYAFRYLCDGVWFNDEAADAYEPNEFGVDNSILDLTAVG